jgi:hypothetical protein
MPALSRSATIDAPADRVFANVDDIRNLARHMSERSSMPMMGARLALQIVTPDPTGVGATYRYSGRAIGFAIDFSETVTRYVPGREKVWRTIGEPRLLILDSYEMRLLVEPETDTSARLTITIDYALPRTGLRHFLGRSLAAPYARWCLGNMIEGTVQELPGGEA